MPRTSVGPLFFGSPEEESHAEALRPRSAMELCFGPHFFIREVSDFSKVIFPAAASAFFAPLRETSFAFLTSAACKVLLDGMLAFGGRVDCGLFGPFGF